MFDLENEIQRWIVKLRRNPGFEDGDISEMEDHIRDSIELGIDKGLSKREAFEKAVSSFGSLDNTGSEMMKSRTAKMKLPKSDILAHNYTSSTNRITNATIMFSNYLKIALRIIRKNRGTSFINLLGMSIGFASIIIIINWTYNEFSFDKFHKNKDRIYRVIEKQSFQGQDVKYLSSMPEWFIGTFEEDIPGVVASTGLFNVGNIWFGEKDNSIEVKNVTYTDNNIFKIFTLNFISGNPEKALQEPYSLVLTESLSNKLFKDISPVGKTILFQNKNEYTITGVIEDIPGNSHFQAEILVSIEERKPMWDRESYNHTTSIYLLLDDNTNPVSLWDPLQKSKKLHMSKTAEFLELQIQPLSDIHLFSKHTMWGQNWKKSDISLVMILMFVGILVVVISTINYVNLSTALIAKRFSEFGLKKIVGSSKFNLVIQYLFESFTLLFISFLVSMLIIEIVNPILISSKILEQTNNIYHQFWFFPLVIGFIISLTILSSIYPAIILSSIKPINLLRKNINLSKRGIPLRNALVVMQLVITCTLLITVSYVFKQIKYMENSELGYRKEAVINFWSGADYISGYETIKADLLAHSTIEDITSSNIPLGNSMWRNCIHFEGENENDNWVTPYLMVDYNFIDFYGIKIIDGRSFNKDYTLDKNEQAFLINETLAKAIGGENIVGRKFRICDSEWGEIVGIVQDFNYRSLHHNIEPLAIRIGLDYKYMISVKVSSGNIRGAIVILEKTWNIYQPDQPFQYSFLDDRLNSLYESEKRTVKIQTIFSVISILLLCIGILGVFMIISELKTKEVGIRKVHGASSINILIMLSQGLITNIALSLVIAIPLAWLAINLWRENFAYTTDISWWIFGISGALILLLAWFTVSFYAIKAANRNPIEALRYE